MWYKYLDRSSDVVRVWRRTNLKFNQDDFGMFKNKHPSAITDALYRMARSEGPFRSCSVFIIFTTLSCLLWYKKQHKLKHAHEQEKKKQEEKDALNQVARKQLWYNRFDVPSRPNKSIDNFMTFLASEQALNTVFEYMSYKGTSDTYEDYQKGLDTWASEEDKKMLKYYKESLKFSSHH